MKKALAAISFVGAFVIVACLPGDLRPEPGHVYIGIEGSDAALNGFVTEDGWTIHFEKLLVGAGYTELEGEDCEVYGQARYTQLFDFAVPGKQKLGDLYGLNGCNIVFTAAASFGRYLGNGVTIADRDSMRDRVDFLPNAYRIASTYVRGNARRGSVTKVFSWKFQGYHVFNECGNPLDGTVATSLQLKGGDEYRPMVTFHPDELFRDNIEIDAKFRFDALAAADTNADGEVSLEELSKIPAPVVELTLEEYRDAGAPDGGYIVDENTKTKGWALFMSQLLLVLAFRVDGQPCRYNRDLPTGFKYKYPYDFL